MREQKNERPKALKYRRLEECENGSPNKWKNQHAKAFKKKTHDGDHQDLFKTRKNQTDYVYCATTLHWNVTKIGKIRN